MKRSFVLVLGLAACASAGGERPPGDGDPGQDGNTTIDASIDAVPPDAPPQMVTLSQNVSTTATGNSFACTQTNFTRENSYYRVFSLAEHGVPGMFQVQRVSFVVQTATAGSGATQPGQVKIGRYMGAAGGSSIDLVQVMPVNSATVAIPNGAGTVNVPITGTFPGGNIIVELAIPDGFAAQNTFFIGTNGAGETKPGYIRAPAQGCNLVSPVGMNALGAAQSPPLPKTDLIMTVTGLKF